VAKKKNVQKEGKLKSKSRLRLAAGQGGTGGGKVQESHWNVRPGPGGRKKGKWGKIWRTRPNPKCEREKTGTGRGERPLTTSQQLKQSKEKQVRQGNTNGPVVGGITQTNPGKNPQASQRGAGGRGGEDGQVQLKKMNRRQEYGGEMRQKRCLRVIMAEGGGVWKKVTWLTFERKKEKKRPYRVCSGYWQYLEIGRPMAGGTASGRKNCAEKWQQRPRIEPSPSSGQKKKVNT